MRKIERDIIRAWKNGEKRTIKNTRTDGQSIYLHGYEIVTRRDNGEVIASMCGWPTVTTRSRLNAVCVALNGHARFHQSDWQQYFDDEPIDSTDIVQLL